jgi:DnaK suppressor protein
MTIHLAGQPLGHPDVRDRLEGIANSRERQLHQLPEEAADLVAAAHRSSVERILGQVRAAQQRLEDGTYGLCVDCGATMSPEWLEELPWTPTCAWCSRR